MAADGRIAVPPGSMGFRYSEDGAGQWNLDLGDIQPALTFIDDDAAEAVEAVHDAFALFRTGRRPRQVAGEFAEGPQVGHRHHHRQLHRYRHQPDSLHHHQPHHQVQLRQYVALLET